jgi:hypothetical protein
MVVDAIVNGAEQVDSISVVVPVVRIEPEKNSMKPSIRTPFVNENNPGRQELQTQAIKITVAGFNGVAIPSKTVNLTHQPAREPQVTVTQGGNRLETFSAHREYPVGQQSKLTRIRAEQSQSTI